MKFMGHDVEAKPKPRSRDGLLYAYIDGHLAPDIPPSKYAGAVYRRVKARRQDTFKQEMDHGNTYRIQYETS